MMIRDKPHNEGAPELYITRQEAADWQLSPAWLKFRIRPEVMVALIVGYHFAKSMWGVASVQGVLGLAITNWGRAGPSTGQFLRAWSAAEKVLTDPKGEAKPLFDALTRSRWHDYLLTKSAPGNIASAHIRWEAYAVNDHTTMMCVSQLITLIERGGRAASANVGKDTERRLTSNDIDIGKLTGQREHPALARARAQAREKANDEKVTAPAPPTSFIAEDEEWFSLKVNWEVTISVLALGISLLSLGLSILRLLKG